jgi:hypothetical protein
MRLAKMVGKQWDEVAHDALDRMRRAHQRGLGCYLTAEMIQSLALTHLAELWGDERPTTPNTVNRPLPVARRTRQRGADKLSSDPRLSPPGETARAGLLGAFPTLIRQRLRLSARRSLIAIN